MDMKEELIDGSFIKVPLFGDCISVQVALFLLEF